MKILIIDNYDSFTYNLLHYVQQFADEVEVQRNDAIAVEYAEGFSHLIISPGPGLPDAAGISLSLIEKYHQSKPILGVCLGCQAIAEYFGGRLYNQSKVAHGVQREVLKTDPRSLLLKSLPKKFKVGLYHSWAVDEKSLPPELKVTAKSTSGVVMALEHRFLPIAGVQFHPESIMTENGLQILKNWLEAYALPSAIDPALL